MQLIYLAYWCNNLMSHALCTCVYVYILFLFHIFMGFATLSESTLIKTFHSCQTCLLGTAIPVHPVFNH